MGAQHFKTVAGFGLAVALAACSAAPAVSPTPVARPPSAPAPSVPVTSLPASAESQALAAYYAQVQADLLTQGLLRTDGGGADTPFTDTMLAENFIRIALFDEYARASGGGLVAQQTQSRLRRWQGPVRVELRFGASVPPARQATDRARIASYLQRLSAITGHPIALVPSGGNFHIQIVNEEERRALGPTIARDLPGLNGADIAGLTNLPRSTYCIVYALSPGNASAYNAAFAVIRAEHPDLLRLSCIHEEIAQGLGLANDSPLARPSIFNDDEEFALLTRQDEMMLRILYNPALRPGMTAAEARPVVQALAAQMMGGS